MEYSIEKSTAILLNTPDVLSTLLKNVSSDWTMTNEGDDTWSVFDIIGHLIQGEKTDWIPRMEIIFSDKNDKTFEPLDRFAQLQLNKGKTLSQLLSEFKVLRQRNILHLQSKKITPNMLQITGTHPALGEVTLAQLLATWVVHDLNHIAQIVRVMAKQYANEVGPWKEYLKILQ